MIVWALGDAAIREAVAAFAAAHGATVVDVTAAGAPVEAIWADQLFAPAMRRTVAESWRGTGEAAADVVVVVFVDDPDYDAEGTVGRLAQRLNVTHARVLYLVRADATDNTRDAFAHYPEPWLRHGVLGLDTLEDLYARDV